MRSSVLSRTTPSQRRRSPSGAASIRPRATTMRIDPSGRTIRHSVTSPSGGTASGSARTCSATRSSSWSIVMAGVPNGNPAWALPGPAPAHARLSEGDRVVAS
jgi:hypothetical protein